MNIMTSQITDDTTVCAQQFGHTNDDINTKTWPFVKGIHSSVQKSFRYLNVTMINETHTMYSQLTFSISSQWELRSPRSLRASEGLPHCCYPSRTTVQMTTRRSRIDCHRPPVSINTNGHRFADGILKFILMIKNNRIFIQISPNFSSKEYIQQ